MRNQPRWYQRKVVYGLAILVALLVIVRILAPSLTLKKLNATLGSLSGPVCGHMDDFGLSLFRGAYRIDHLELKRWNTEHTECRETLLSIGLAEVSLAWGPLLHGDARLGIDIKNADIKADQLVNAFHHTKSKTEAAEEAKTGAQQSWDTLVPWRIDSVRIENSKVSYQLLGPKGITAPMDNVNAEVTGIDSKMASSQPILFRFRASVFQGAPLLLSGSFAMGKETRWKADYDLRNFHLTDANTFLKDQLPLTFEKGDFSLFGEAIGKGAWIDGYARLFFDHIQVLGKKDDFKTFKRAAVELVTALFFAVTKAPFDHSTATEISFRGTSPNIDVDYVGALARTVQHLAGKRIPRGIDNRLEIPKP